MVPRFITSVQRTVEVTFLAERRHELVHVSISKASRIPQRSLDVRGDDAEDDPGDESSGHDEAVSRAAAEGPGRDDEDALVEAALAYLTEPVASLPAHGAQRTVPSLWKFCSVSLARKTKTKAACPVTSGPTTVWRNPVDVEMPAAGAQVTRDIGDVAPSEGSEGGQAAAKKPRTNDDDGINLEELRELVELEAIGENVLWPAGWDAQTARVAVHQRPSCKEPASKRVKPNGESSGHVSIGGPAPVLASAPASSSAVTASSKLAVHKLGAGHDLRRSGRLVWCRECGCYAEEKIRKDGLGGHCKGRQARNPTQYDRLRRGLHPQKDAFLPPDVAFAA